jgi:hypothetical protein
VVAAVAYAGGVTLRICASVRRHRFGISEIGNLSTGFPRLHPHLLWKTIARRFEHTGHFFISA